MNSLPDSGFGWIPGGRILADRINQRSNFKAADPLAAFLFFAHFRRRTVTHSRHTARGAWRLPKFLSIFDFNLRGWDFSQPAEKAKQPLDQTSHELEQAAE